MQQRGNDSLEMYRVGPFQLREYIQIMCANRYSSSVSVLCADHSRGELAVVDGVLWTASYRDLSAYDALLHLLRNHVIEMSCRDLYEAPEERSLTCTWESVYFDLCAGEEQEQKQAPGALVEGDRCADSSVCLDSISTAETASLDAREPLNNGEQLVSRRQTIIGTPLPNALAEASLMSVDSMLELSREAHLYRPQLLALSGTKGLYGASIAEVRTGRDLGQVGELSPVMIKAAAVLVRQNRLKAKETISAKELLFSFGSKYHLIYDLDSRLFLYAVLDKQAHLLRDARNILGSLASIPT